ncbi:DNA excision repair protein ERCC-6-like [Uloborus diversus]|uniref:DNA excision repair protein ERCC-6-like n=1 Tax=Uloborus diversus TaxID=327109 RepID=UPI002409B50C|nr:DNA excision repair protein ERCC-6-like [Uloborus diversus]
MEEEDLEENSMDKDYENVISLREHLIKCSDALASSDASNMALNEDSTMGGTLDPSLPSSSKANNFEVCTESIPCVPVDDQNNELFDLDVTVYDQTQFESEVMSQVDKAMKAQEEQRRKEEVERELKSVLEDIRFAKRRLNHIEKALSMAPKDPALMTNAAKRELTSIQKEQENKMKHLKKLEAKEKALKACLSGNVEEISSTVESTIENEEMDEETVYHLKKVFAAKETEEERLIRMGEMTPFGSMASSQNKSAPRKIIMPNNELTDFDKFLLNEAESHAKKKSTKPSYKQSTPSTSKASTSNAMSPKSESSKSTTSFNSLNLKLDGPNFEKSESEEFVAFTDLKAVSRHKRKVKVKLGSKHAKGFSKKRSLKRSLVKNYRSDSDVSDVNISDEEDMDGSDEEYLPGKYSEDDEEYTKKLSSKKKGNSSAQKTLHFSDDSETESARVRSPTKKKTIDDGDQKAFIKRIKAHEKAELMRKHEKILESKDGIVESDEEEFHEFEGEYKIPIKTWQKLYKYQQTGVRWLWELHQENCGGIIGDEMGLGKTIQVIAFFIGLKCSNLLTDGDGFRGLGPVILVCPATVMHQWVKEFQTWAPLFRVAILHESGSFNGKKEVLIRQINKCKGVLITSYAGVVQHQTTLLEHEWHYIVLDEGHKIRNPDAQATLAVKQFRTSHRIILSGSPVQNNLKELWSLFDFIFPGKLGTLPVFMQQFSVPIVLGGYANASQIQVQTAYKCATVLRDSIKPYLLRRMKSDVKMSINLPNKSEQVLFCQLTEEQANLYKGYINSKEVDSILSARLQVFVGLINLRKICNHPDIFDGGPKIFKDTDLSLLSEEEKYGYYKRSGKMIVVEALLRLWHKQKHRVLLFTQSRQMMEILEIFVKSRGYTYMKMDGSTSISSRQPAITKFNSDKNIFVFLLTTRVGGLGVNLTGADRVVIYDPDWNPSTDAQARERAWRIGQEKQVTIYRLLTAGTIEEKIYHRQIFKQFVTNRVLKDPRQRRFFKSNDLYELFTFSEVGKQGTETSAIFAGTGSEIKVKKKVHAPQQQPSQAEKDSAVQPQKADASAVKFSAEKLEKMKQLARKLASEISMKKSEPSTVTENPLPGVSEESKKKSDTPDGKKHKSQASSEQVSKDSPRKRAKKRKASRVDGEKIDFVVKTDTYKPPQDESELNATQDDYVLSKLFKTSGVHTALKHDAIVDASSADYMIVEGEANRVAKEAVKVLKESRRFCARAAEGIPTWTGQNGGKRLLFGQKKSRPVSAASNSSPNSKASSSSASQGKKKEFFSGKKPKNTDLSSSDVLSAIKKRSVVFGTDMQSDSDEESSTHTPTNTCASPKSVELLDEIRNFIAFQCAVDGEATTSEILAHFRERVPASQSPVFKSLLNNICDFHRTSDGRGVWKLKEDLR